MGGCDNTQKHPPTISARDFKEPVKVAVPFIIDDTTGFKDEAIIYKKNAPTLRSERYGLKMGIPIDVVENGKNERDAKVKFALDMENSEFVDLCKRGGVHKFRTIEGVDDEI